MTARRSANPRPTCNPARVMVVPRDSASAPAHSEVAWRPAAGLILVLVLWCLPLCTTSRAQEDELKKVPVLDKITSGGPSQQQIVGVVKSVDLESEVLNIDNDNGKSTEVFPLKKKVHVVTADGDKVKLATLKPGTKVLVYFDQKGDRRNITLIEVLAGGPPKKKAPPS